MSDLTDFLLARIAEDEANSMGATYDHGDSDVMPSEDSVCMSPTRFRAECEARRRIVERAQRASQAFAGDINPTSSGVALTMDLVLADLAQPYADHPDYREEWKP